MDHREKLKWARNHLDALQRELDAFIDSKPYEVSVKFEPEEVGYTAYIKGFKVFPPHWSLMVGDIVHNARSSLDTLAYSFASKHLRRTPDADEIRNIQWIIIDDLKDWYGEFCRRKVVFDLAMWAEMFWVQPCLRTDFTQRNQLSVLRDLSNIDKHRHLLITVASATSASIKLFSPYLDAGTTIQGYVGPLEKGTVIGRWKIKFGTKTLTPAEHGEVDARANLGLDIQFGESIATPRGGSVIPYLGAVIDYIEKEIFPPCELLL